MTWARLRQMGAGALAERRADRGRSPGSWPSGTGSTCPLRAGGTRPTTCWRASRARPTARPAAAAGRLAVPRAAEAAEVTALVAIRRERHVPPRGTRPRRCGASSPRTGLAAAEAPPFRDAPARRASTRSAEFKLREGRRGGPRRNHRAGCLSARNRFRPSRGWGRDGGDLDEGSAQARCFGGWLRCLLLLLPPAQLPVRRSSGLQDLREVTRPPRIQRLEAPKSAVLAWFVHVPPPEKEVGEVVDCVGKLRDLWIGRAARRE